MKKILLTLAALASVSACTGEDTGACVSTPGISGLTYCGDNYTASECSHLDAIGASGASTWYFHEGQTCAGRGLVPQL